MMPSLAKELMMNEITKQFEENPYAFVLTFNGLTVADIAEYRRSIGKVASRSLVVKHSMAKKILAGRKMEAAEKFLKNSVVFTFGTKDPQMISKAIVDFAKMHEKIVPAGVVFEDQVYDAEFVKRLAKLPSRHELLTQVVTRIKSPITGLVMTLGQVMRGLVIAINEIKKQKEAVPQTA